MLRNGNMLYALAQTNRETRNVYLNVVDHSVQDTDVTTQAQSINSLLSEAKTRAIGLRFLIEYLNRSTQNVIQDKASHWLSIVLRACNLKEIRSYGELIYETLALLVAKIQTIPDISKWFGATYLLKFYESLSLMEQRTSLCCTISVLKSIKQCLKYYPGPSKSGKNLVMRYLVTVLDSNDQDVVYQSGCCWLLLQQVRNNSNNTGSFNDKTQWQHYQIGILGNLNTLLNEAFPNYENVCNTIVVSHKLEPFELILKGDPIERAAQASRRFCNIIEFLKIALSFPYSSHKLIHPTKILGLVQRGLGMNFTNCETSPSIDTMFLGHFLPQMHTKLLELLEVLIDICHTHLRMHFPLITDLLLATLKNTKCLSIGGTPLHFINLRCKVYEVTRLWLTTFVEGSGYDLILEHLIKNIFEDIQICQTDICLVSAPLSKKSPGNKNKEAYLTKSEKSFPRKTIINKSAELVCGQALRCLQAVLLSVGHLLKPSFLKDIFNTILEIGVQIYEKRIIMQYPYNDWHNRLEVYETLFAFISLRNLSYPPPTEIIIHMLIEAYSKDPRFEVRSRCKIMIDSIEKILHPQKESLIFKLHVENLISATKSVEPQKNVIYKNPIEALQKKENLNSFQSDTIDHTTVQISKSANGETSEFIPLGILKKTQISSTAMSIENQVCIDKPAVSDIMVTFDAK
ncbi:proline-, glutamic acid- and leucine-rich protein 1 isoform X2 [Drosophila innubila]|uniref:proline-, glutamic acid- and leucine-rich protein 1 isoform X2 n=1 Tax=Drosophila innubila TaxID=198719 RepID=UPI00148CD4EE|nr:proline-, glutamic acid- and leucine-rich protein 1 isoform X2 [Drosophila innubila]